MILRARTPFADRDINRQNANFQTSQLTIQQRLLYIKQISYKILKNPKIFLTLSCGKEKSGYIYYVSNIKQRHIKKEKYSATSPEKTLYRRENPFSKRFNISLSLTKSYAKMPFKQNSLLTGTGFVGIINFLNFIYFL